MEGNKEGDGARAMEKTMTMAVVEEGDSKGGKSDGDGNKESNSKGSKSDGNGNKVEGARHLHAGLCQDMALPCQS